MGITTTLTIDGTSYTAAQRAGVARIGIDELSRSLDGYDTLSFHEFSNAPTPTWSDYKTVSLKTTPDNTVRFSGYITKCQSGESGEGWKHGYQVMGLRWAVDKFVPVEAADGTGTIVLNRPPDDAYGVPTDRGLTVGQIVTRALTVVNTATRLNALGVGGYTSLSPPTLPASLVTQLAALSVVPRGTVILQGNGILNVLSAFVARWMPRYVLELTPAGVINFKDTTSLTTFPASTITLASRNGPGAPLASFPAVTRSSERTATRLVFRGGSEIESAMLSLVDATLAEGFTSTDKTNWNLTYFTTPVGAYDTGTITSMTSTSATLQSADPTVVWSTNFWSNKQASVWMINTAGTGINIQEYRTVIANAALTAGGTASVSWDSTWPVNNTSYTKYRISGSSGSLIDCWRLYLVADPAAGTTGLNTFIGPRLVRKSPKIIKWANNSKSLGEYYTQAVIVGGSPQTSLPLQAEPVPSLGGFRFTQPTVTVYGSPSALNSGSPTTVGAGLPADVQILALYSRGALTVTVPPDVAGVPQYSNPGAAQGIHVTEYLDYPGWTWKGDTADMTTLANEHLAVSSQVVYEASFDWLVGASGTLPAWDWWNFATSINFAINGTTSPWSAINAPIRSFRLKWTAGPRSGPIHTISFSASNQRRPFTGDDLFIHPQFSQGSPLDGGGELGKSIISASGDAASMPNVAGGVLSGAANFASDATSAATQAASSFDPAAALQNFGIDVSPQDPVAGGGLGGGGGRRKGRPTDEQYQQNYEGFAGIFNPRMPGEGGGGEQEG